MRARIAAVWLMLITMLLAGCKVGPDYKRPEMGVPPDWSQAPSTRPSPQPGEAIRWWTSFNDPILDSLVAQAIASNRDLKIATARVREARALRRIAESGLWPSANASASYSRGKGSENIGFEDIGALSASGISRGGTGTPGTPAPGGGAGLFNPAIISAERDLWQAGFDASWELDIFGGIRRSIEAADADLLAAQEARRDVLVSLVAELATNYLDLRGLQRQMQTARANIKAQQDTVELTRVRSRTGLAGDLDLVRAEAQVATTSSQLPLLQAAARRNIHRIGVLIGQWPGSLAEELTKPSPIPTTQPAVPVGLPSDLLRRRGDVRRAEAQLHAATARIGVATADLFPKFSLTGGFGLQSDKAKTLFNSDSNYWSIGPGVRLPLFDRGRIRANIEVHNARTEQALQVYEGTVTRAVEEVENALSALREDQDRWRFLAEAVRASRRAVELAKNLNQPGLVSFLDVLEAERSLYQVEEQLVASERAVSTDYVALYKALGGGWEFESIAQGPQTQPAINVPGPSRQ